MPAFGGFSTFPIRFGGGETRIKTIYDSLNESLGTGYDTSYASNVTAETMAEARAIAAVWSASRRMSLQWDPMRMSDFVGRWEKIFGVIPAPSDSMSARQAVLALKFRALAGPIAGNVEDAASTLLGDAYVGVEFTTPAQANQSWPSSTPPSATNFYSFVAHILVRVQQPSTMTFSQFITLMGKLTSMLDDLLPAWVSSDWGMFGANGLNGFYLDENNLDAQTFD